AQPHQHRDADRAQPAARGRAARAWRPQQRLHARRHQRGAAPDGNLLWRPGRGRQLPDRARSARGLGDRDALERGEDLLDEPLVLPALLERGDAERDLLRAGVGELADLSDDLLGRAVRDPDVEARSRDVEAVVRVEELLRLVRRGLAYFVD